MSELFPLVGANKNIEMVVIVHIHIIIIVVVVVVVVVREYYTDDEE